MKTLITLNIGLNTIANTRVDLHHAIGAIQACGVSLTASAVVNGEWEGKPEQTLFLQVFVVDPYAVGFRAQLYLASRLLSQHCFALYCDGKGDLIGDNPERWEFDAALFHFHAEGNPRPQLSECQAIQAEHARKIAERSKVQLSPCQSIQAEYAARIAKNNDAACIRAMGREFDGGFREAAKREYAETYGEPVPEH